MRFEMLGGQHTDDNGATRVFRKGKRTVVESDKELDKMFKNSFRRIDEVTKVPKDHRDTPDHSGGQVMDDLLGKKKKKKVKARDELEDLTPKKANRPRAVGKAQEQDQKRSVIRETQNDEDELEEDEDLDELDEDETEEEETEEKDEAEETETEETETEEEEEDPEPVPEVVKAKPKKKMKVKKSK